MSLKKEKLSKVVCCCKCQKQGYIFGLWLAPKGWKRLYTNTKYIYVYYCKDCYNKYVLGNTLF